MRRIKETVINILYVFTIYILIEVDRYLEYSLCNFLCVLDSPVRICVCNVQWCAGSFAHVYTSFWIFLEFYKILSKKCDESVLDLIYVIWSLRIIISIYYIEDHGWYSVSKYSVAMKVFWKGLLQC